MQPLTKVTQVRHQERNDIHPMLVEILKVERVRIALRLLIEQLGDAFNPSEFGKLASKSVVRWVPKSMSAVDGMSRRRSSPC